MLIIRLFLLVCLVLAGSFAPDAEAKTAPKPTAKPAPKAAEKKADKPAESASLQNYRRTFAALDANRGETAIAFARSGHDFTLNKVLTGYFMALPGNGYHFADMAKFIEDNPNWPGLTGILAITEQKLPGTYTPAETVAWFSVHPPVTMVGFNRYIEALDASGNTEESFRQIRARWVDGALSRNEFQDFVGRYSARLDAASNWARLDRLLWKNAVEDARWLYPYVTADQKTVAEARIAVNARSPRVNALLAQVPTNWRMDEGLQFALLRWYVNDKADERAIDVLQKQPDNSDHAALWWEQRQTIIYRLMEKRDYTTAYRLANDNGQSIGKQLLQAEFMAGWISLRLLNNADEAEKHFRKLGDSAQTPVSRARGAYWLARTYETMGDKDRAEQSYEDAAAFGTTYYGQLASTRIFANPTIQVRSEPLIPANIRADFYQNDLVMAVQKLYSIGQIDRAHVFFTAAINAAEQRVDFVLLTELGYKIGRPDYAIEAAKAANQKGFLMAASGYPLMKHKLPDEPESAFIHALIRQESHFNPEAGSVVGAQGLMQLMPATAKSVARSLGIKYRTSMLTNPDYNIRLGTRYVQSLINRYNGSYVLALAGYNAGPGRVSEWLSDYGDPRTSAVDPIDWIEMLPLSETRNYIQRIMENLQAYRARQNNGEASLLILNDLRR